MSRRWHVYRDETGCGQNRRQPGGVAEGRAEPVETSQVTGWRMFGKVSVFQIKDDVGSDRRAEKSRSCCCAVANWLKSIAATGAEGKSQRERASAAAFCTPGTQRKSVVNSAMKLRCRSCRGLLFWERLWIACVMGL